MNSAVTSRFIRTSIKLQQSLYTKIVIVAYAMIAKEIVDKITDMCNHAKKVLSFAKKTLGSTFTGTYQLHVMWRVEGILNLYGSKKITLRGLCATFRKALGVNKFDSQEPVEGGCALVALSSFAPFAPPSVLASSYYSIVFTTFN